MIGKNTKNLKVAIIACKRAIDEVEIAAIEAGFYGQELAVNQIETTLPIDIMFEEWWKLYPRKVNKKKTYTLFVKIIKSGSVDFDSLINTTTRYVEYLELTNQFTMHPTTYLNGERWNDKLELEGSTFDSVLGVLRRNRR